MTDGGGDRRRIARRLGVMALAVAAVLVVVLAVAGVALYLARLQVARQAALAWIGAQHVPADVQVRSLGPTGLKAKVRIGPAGDPDLTIDEVDVSYSLGSFLRGQGLKLSAVRLRRPVLRARLRNGRLDLGAVDRLTAALKPRPGAPPAPPPRIEVRSGLVRLQSDYGAADISADADIDQGRLDRLHATLAPTVLRVKGISGRLGAAWVSAVRAGDGLTIAARARLDQVRLAQGTVSGAVLSLRADLSYAALERGRAQGRASARATAAAASAAGVEARGVTLEAQAPVLALGPDGGSGRFHVRGAIAGIRQGELRLAGLSTEGAVSLSASKAGVAAAFVGGVAGAGVSTALGPPAKDDAPVLLAAKRALTSFRFSAGKAELSLDHGRLSGRLLAPVRVRSASGGALDVEPAGAGYSLALGGGGLPQATADVGRPDVSDAGVSARARVAAAFSLGILDQAQVKADGRLTLKGSQAAFSAARCAEVAVKRIDLGDNSADDFVARLCPSGGPMLAFSPGRWSIAGRAEGAAAKVPAFEAALSEGAGSLRLSGRGQDLAAEVVIDRARVADLAKPLRFYPVIASGRAALAHDLFSGSGEVRTPRGQPVAHADFRDDLKSLKGGLTLSAPLTFAQGGLQPTQLSPLTAALGEPASGRITFDGRFDWAGDKTTSRGRLVAQDLSFRSPAGPVSGFSGAMTFTSLAPLVGATEGAVKADRIAGVVALADVSARARIDGQSLTVSDGEGAIGGGHVRVDATASLAPDQTVKGVVAMDKVQVHDLVQASPFSDKVSMTAQISGRLPFQMSGGKLRIAQGVADADGPGRLSIKRSTFNPDGAPAGPATQDNLSTFGYQAMEDLAFQTLDASIDSLPDGKLHMVFHVKGRHDPPMKKELRLTWRDFFDRDILNKPMPLPSGTGVNLTLDTTLNLDNLIKSEAALHKELGSVSVQTQGATVGANTAEGPQ